MTIPILISLVCIISAGLSCFGVGIRYGRFKAAMQPKKGPLYLTEAEGQLLIDMLYELTLATKDAMKERKTVADKDEMSGLMLQNDIAYGALSKINRLITEQPATL